MSCPNPSDLVTSRPFDAWTVVAGDLEPLGSFATEASARGSVAGAGLGAVSTGHELLWTLNLTADERDLLAQAVGRPSDRCAACARAAERDNEPPPAPPPARRWSRYQEALFAAVAEGERHVVTIARAGSGKTTSILECVRRYREADPGARVLVCAFNVVIRDELKARIGAAAGVDVMTLHGLGYAALRRKWGKVFPEKKKNARSRAFAAKVTPEDLTVEDREKVRQLVAWTKQWLVEDDASILRFQRERELTIDWTWYAEDDNPPRYGADDLCRWVRAALAAAREQSAEVDFDDMIYVPAALGLRVGNYDMVFVDEAQDLNVAQIALAKRARARDGRIVAVGDDRQAVYQFRGADPRSIQNLVDELGKQPRGVEVLRLPVTYRCGRAIAELAREWVPDLESPEEVHEGVVERVGLDRLHGGWAPGDFVISRLNAPLVTLCLRALADGIPARIQGRDITSGLRALLARSKQSEVAPFLRWLASWESAECERLEARGDDPETASDRAAVLRNLCAGLRTLEQVKLRMEQLFGRDGDESAEGGAPPSATLVFTTAHRSKGLEADRVWILRHRFLEPRKPEETETEENLWYVAVTRAKQALYLVAGRP